MAYVQQLMLYKFERAKVFYYLFQEFLDYDDNGVGYYTEEDSEANGGHIEL